MNWTRDVETCAFTRLKVYEDAAVRHDEFVGLFHNSLGSYRQTQEWNVYTLFLVVDWEIFVAEEAAGLCKT
jgi:hypothetical protein